MNDLQNFLIPILRYCFAVLNFIGFLVEILNKMRYYSSYARIVCLSTICFAFLFYFERVDVDGF